MQVFVPNISIGEINAERAVLQLHNSTPSFVCLD